MRKKLTGGDSARIGKGWELLCIFLICLIPRLYVSLNAYPLTSLSDEASSMSAAAFAAGYDWRDVVSHAGYYGFGILFIFAPLFRLPLSPVWIYRIIMAVLSAVEALGGVICYRMVNRLAPELSRIRRMLIAVICGLAALLSTVNIMNRNEEALSLVMWLLMDLLSRILTDGTERKKWNRELGILLLMMYSLTLHTRAAMFFIAMGFISVVYAVLRKKTLFHWWFYLGMAAGFLLMRWLVGLYQAQIWRDAETIRNTSVSDSVGSFFRLVQTEGLNGTMLYIFLQTVLGQMYTASITTGGLFCVGIVAFILFGIRPKLAREDKPYEILFFCGIFSLLCVMATSGAQGLSWMSGIYNGVEYSQKAFTYTRYFGVYAPPVLMCGLVLLFRNEEKRKKVLLWTILITTVLTVFWSVWIYPTMAEYWTKTVDKGFTLLAQQPIGKKAGNQHWTQACMLFGEIVLVWCGLWYRKKETAALVFLAVYMITVRIYTFENLYLIDENKNLAKSDAGTALITVLRETEDVSEIYVADTPGKTKQQIYQGYQFMNRDIHVIPDVPDETVKDALLFSNLKLYESLPEDYQYAKLDNNEYVYARGKWIDAVKTADYRLIPVQNAGQTQGLP